MAKKSKKKDVKNKSPVTKKAVKAENRQQIPISDERLLDWLGIDPETDAKSEVTYFTCLKMLSETVGKLPIHYYQHTDGGRIRADMTDAARLLAVRPNPYMTPTTLMTVTEFNCQHYGNAFILIHTRLVMDGKYNGHIEHLGLYPMHPNDVTLWIDNKGIFGQEETIKYEWRDPLTNKSYIFDNEDVMHFKTWYSKDGITGEPVRNILTDTIGSAVDSQKVMSNMYKNGLTASMVMQYTSDIDEARIKQLQKKFADKLTGPQAAGKVIPIPIGLQLTPLNAKLTDSQFYELKKYSALQIAAAFGIKPNQINDYDKSSYSNSEQQQLSFLVDTMQYRLKLYEEEINAKLLLKQEQLDGYYFKFNEKAILRTDTKTQMDMLAEGVQNGIYTPNEAREYLDMADAEGGDILMANGNFIPVTMVGSQYNSTSDGQKGGNG